MERLRGSSARCQPHKAAVSARLFNLAYPVTAAGTQSVSQRDLGLLLEAVALTATRRRRSLSSRRGCAGAADVRAEIGAEQPDRVPILRKVVNHRRHRRQLAVGGDAEAPGHQTARGSLAQAIADLSPPRPGCAAAGARRQPADAVNDPAERFDCGPLGDLASLPGGRGAGYARRRGRRGPRASVCRDVRRGRSPPRRAGVAPGDAGDAPAGWRAGPGPGLQLNTIQRRRLAPPTAREGGYTPGFVTRGASCPRLRAGHGRTNRRGVAGDGARDARGWARMGTPRGSAGGKRGAPGGAAATRPPGAFAARARENRAPRRLAVSPRVRERLRSKPAASAAARPGRRAHTFGGGCGGLGAGGGAGGAGGVGSMGSMGSMGGMGAWGTSATATRSSRGWRPRRAPPAPAAGGVSCARRRNATSEIRAEPRAAHPRLREWALRRGVRRLPRRPGRNPCRRTRRACPPSGTRL